MAEANGRWQKTHDKRQICHQSSVICPLPLPADGRRHMTNIKSVTCHQPSVICPLPSATSSPDRPSAGRPAGAGIEGGRGGDADGVQVAGLLLLEGGGDAVDDPA